MNTIIGELGKSSKFIELTNKIETKQSPIAISGLNDMGMLQVISAIYEFTKKPICLLTYNEIQAKKIYKDLKYFTDKEIDIFNKKEVVTYDYVAESKDIQYERIDALNKVQDNKCKILVTTIEAAMQKLPSEKTLYKNKMKIKTGEIYNLEEIKRKLVNLGYERQDLVEARGQFSVRGGIVDVALDDKIGIRIEFWGDEVDSIRDFSISSQRSIHGIGTATINPAHEYVLEEGTENISQIDKYFNNYYEEQVTILDYLKNNYCIFIDEIGKIKQRAKNIKIDNRNLEKALIEKERRIPDAISNMLDFENIEDILSKKQLVYIEKQDTRLDIGAEKYKFEFRDVNYYKSEIDSLFKELKNAIKEKKKIYLLVETQEKAKKLKALLEEQEIICKIEKKLNQTIIAKSNEAVVTITIGKLSSGFENYDLNQLIIVADDLISGEKKKRRVTSSAFKEGEKVVFNDLKIGDYVVHRKYGIGIYVGVNTIKADGTIKDYIKIKYQKEDILYIPTNDLDSIRKYIGGDKIQPKINRLGSKDWENTKAKVKKNLREVAKELIELYAKREKSLGYAFSKDNPWQAEFEGKFPYQETDDQLRCIEEVKKDMEMSRPMDRLLCGDVGYGKTEVAIRAAFKAATEGKQVAYLAPTTVLAEQQYNEFKDRMKDYPVTVEILNRFKTKKYQDEVVKKLKLGDVDIVIGTHRLLSKDVEFKDLGLLIIDEEHRFGVKDKEKIKTLKTNVDVLTMTATPIPRTMHMSIVGIRDMSVIYEPPHNRKPVQTYVLEYDKEVIREAITKELERDGQVFYLFNNIEQIARKSEEISDLIPEANVVYAHGRMSGKQIEEIMQDFINKKTNVLVCTTILESGIDIPNANTIIVENADRMGLAQLYQIRGRVGRAERQAYAYITYKKDKLLSEVADKRLKAIKEFTEFGSGFKIAMRDLEIRGAGSLLGEIQSGHLEQVGYDTYCNLLDEVVKEMKGIEIKQEQEIQIDLNVTSYIPEEYIESSDQKIEIYQNIALCKNEDDIQNVIDEIIDRFGDMPSELENLIGVARIKYLAKALNIEKIASKKTAVVFTFSPSANKKEFDIVDLVKKYENRIKFSAGIKQMITLEIGSSNEKEILNKVTEFLKNL